MYKAKILLMSIVLMLSIIFTILTTETVTIDDEQVPFCRKVEFWCKPPYDNGQIVYNRDKDQYLITYITTIPGEVSVQNGIFTEDGQYPVIVDLPDGKYQNLEGFYSLDEGYNDTFEVLDENLRIIGTEL